MCGPNPLPGYGKLELLSKILVEVGSDESKLSISSETRSRIIEALNSLEEHYKKNLDLPTSHVGATRCMVVQRVMLQKQL